MRPLRGPYAKKHYYLIIHLQFSLLLSIYHKYGLNVALLTFIFEERQTSSHVLQSRYILLLQFFTSLWLLIRKRTHQLRQKNLI